MDRPNPYAQPRAVLARAAELKRAGFEVIELCRRVPLPAELAGGCDELDLLYRDAEGRVVAERLSMFGAGFNSPMESYRWAAAGRAAGADRLCLLMLRAELAPTAELQRLMRSGIECVSWQPTREHEG